MEERTTKWLNGRRNERKNKRTNDWTNTRTKEPRNKQMDKETSWYYSPQTARGKTWRNCRTRHRGNTYLTSLPLVSVRPMNVQLSESREKISPRVQAPFSNLCCDKYTYVKRIWKYRGQVLSFLAKVWRSTSVKTSYQNCLEFFILCSNRWLKIEVAARQKKNRVFPRCRRTSNWRWGGMYFTKTHCLALQRDTRPLATPPYL